MGTYVNSVKYLKVKKFVNDSVGSGPALCLEHVGSNPDILCTVVGKCRKLNTPKKSQILKKKYLLDSRSFLRCRTR